MEILKIELKPEDLGKFIRSTMAERKITYRKLKADCGITSATIIRTKNGENIPRLDTLQNLMDYFGYELKISIRERREEDVY